MLQNEMKKGTKGMLKNSWLFRIEDNKKGNVRLATVWGYSTEMTSIYTSDIACIENPVTKQLEKLEMTPDQKKKSDKTKDLMRQVFGD